jgi:hypothetical protein
VLCPHFHTFPHLTFRGEEVTRPTASRVKADHQSHSLILSNDSKWSLHRGGRNDQSWP